jgi:hypothetical protein
MVAKQVPHHRDRSQPVGFGSAALGVCDTRGERLFDENVGTRANRAQGELCMGIRRRGDDHCPSASV